MKICDISMLTFIPFNLEFYLLQLNLILLTEKLKVGLKNATELIWYNFQVNKPDGTRERRDFP